MDNEEKREKLDRLYEQLSKYKGKKHFDNEAKKIKLQIKDIKNIMTDEDWEIFMSERSEIDIRKC